MGLKGLVTFSLFGTLPLYLDGALRNLEIWYNSGLDVDCIFYVGRDVPSEVTRALVAEAGRVTIVNAPCDQTATFWRWDAFRVAELEDYDYVLSRDVDSRPFKKEFDAIDAFLGQTLPIHIMRDHPFHGVPVLAGLFGVKRDMLSDFASMCPMFCPENFYQEVNLKYRTKHTSNNFYQVDQFWLRRKVYPSLRNKIFCHDEFFGFEKKRFKYSLPEDPDGRFLGEGFDENDQPRYPEHRETRLVYEGRRGMLRGR